VFVIGKECIRHPDLLCKIAGEGHFLLGIVREGQAIVLPVLVQVNGDGVVLKGVQDVDIISSIRAFVYARWYRDGSIYGHHGWGGIAVDSSLSSSPLPSSAMRVRAGDASITFSYES
jgi:hypothetical protein